MGQVIALRLSHLTHAARCNDGGSFSLFQCFVHLNRRWTHPDSNEPRRRMSLAVAPTLSHAQTLLLKRPDRPFPESARHHIPQRPASARHGEYVDCATRFRTDRRIHRKPEEMNSGFASA